MTAHEPSAATRGSVLRNFLTLGFGEALSRLVSFGAYVYLARALGAEGYGVVSFAAGLTLYLTKVADFGVEAEGSKVIARSPERIAGLAAAVLGARLALTLAMIVVFGAGVQLLAPQPDRSVLTLYFLTLLPFAASTKWVHVGLENALPVGVYRFVAETIMLGLSLLLVRGPEDAWAVPVAIAAGDAVSSLGLYVSLRRRGHRFGLRWDPQTAFPFLRKAATAMVQVMLGLLLYNLDLLMLRAMRDATTVGYYAAPYMLVSFLGNLGVTYSLILLPNLARKTPEQERDRYHTSLAQAFTVTLPIAIGGMFVAPGLIDLGFGEAYFDHSVIVLQILVWTVPSLTLRRIVWSALYVRGRRRGVIPAYLISVATNAVLNFVLITRYGIMGAAVATIVTELTMGALLTYHAVDDGLPMPSLRRVAKPLPAGILMGGALLWLGELNIAVQILTGGVVYVGTLWAQGILRFAGKTPELRV